MRIKGDIYVAVWVRQSQGQVCEFQAHYMSCSDVL